MKRASLKLVNYSGEPITTGSLVIMIFSPPQSGAIPLRVEADSNIGSHQIKAPLQRQRDGLVPSREDSDALTVTFDLRFPPLLGVHVR